MSNYQPSSTEPLLNAKDIAAILKVSRAQVYTLMEGEIPTIRFGKTVRVKPEALEAFIRSHEIGGSHG